MPPICLGLAFLTTPACLNAINDLTVDNGLYSIICITKHT